MWGIDEVSFPKKSYKKIYLTVLFYKVINLTKRCFNSDEGRRGGDGLKWFEGESMS